MTYKDLRLTPQTIKEIVNEIEMKFRLHTDNISFHFDENAIHIFVFPSKGHRFELIGDPVDVRLNKDEDRWEYAERRT